MIRTLNPVDASSAWSKLMNVLYLIAAIAGGLYAAFGGPVPVEQVCPPCAEFPAPPAPAPAPAPSADVAPLDATDGGAEFQGVEP